MGRCGSGWTRKIVIEPDEIEAMEDILRSRLDCDRIEMLLGRAGSDIAFYYGVAWKASTGIDLEGDDENDE